MANDFLNLMELAIQHHQRGAIIWNQNGLDNPRDVVEIAHIALNEYEKSLDILDNLCTFLAQENIQINVIEASKEYIQGESIGIKIHLIDEHTPSSLQAIINLLEQEIIHREKALHLSQKEEMFEIEISLLRQHSYIFMAKGHKAILCASKALRQGHLVEGLNWYTKAEDIYSQALNKIETEAPELGAILEKCEKNVIERGKNYLNTQIRKVNEGVRWTALAYRFDDEPLNLEYEEIYRRIGANYYVVKSKLLDLYAAQILQNTGSNEDARNLCSQSIDNLYIAMEIFPKNLKFHQDLFQLWLNMGSMFGCPIVETESDYHIQCPLAIMHYTGTWYVSPTFEYDLVCNICGKDPIKCVHYSGQIVDGGVVKYIAENLTILEISLVHVPEDPRCRLEWLSIPKSDFPSNHVKFQCLFCHPERFHDVPFPLLENAPEIVKTNFEKRYRNIMNAKARYTLKINRDTVKN